MRVKNGVQIELGKPPTPGPSPHRLRHAAVYSTPLAFHQTSASNTSTIARLAEEHPMRLRSFVSFVVGTLLGLFAGFAVGIFVYPYIFLADIVASDTVQDQASRQVVASGIFNHPNPSDPIHYGRGDVTVYRDLLHLEGNFEVGPGPKFHVYLVPEAEVTPSTAVDETMFVDLGRLRAFRGSQNYEVPEGVDVVKYPSVVIWCEQFGVLISVAALKPGGK